MAVLSKRVGLLGTENAFKIGPKIRAIEDQGKKVIKCNLGEPDFPFRASSRKRSSDRSTWTTPTTAIPRASFPCGRRSPGISSETRGIDADPGRVVVFPGGKPPIGLSQEAYCDPGTR